MTKKIFGALAAVALVFTTFTAQPAAADYVPNNTSAYTTTNLNLRSGPSTGYRVIRTIPRGSRVYVDWKYNSSWYNVTYSGNRGYVYSAYLSRSSTGDSGGSGSAYLGYASVGNLGFGYANGDRVNRMIRRIRPSSPLNGMGNFIARTAHNRGVDPLIIAQWQFESEMATTGRLKPTNGGSLTWGAAQPYAAAWGCWRGQYFSGRYWAQCPSTSAGVGLFFSYVKGRYGTSMGFYRYANIYNPCWDPYNTGQRCGDSYASAILRLIRDTSS